MMHPSAIFILAARVRGAGIWTNYKFDNGCNRLVRTGKMELKSRFMEANDVYKIITSDLDETLLRKDGSISQQNIDAIAQATARGVKFVPNTGRNFLTVQPLLKQLGLAQQAGEYVISFNGGAVIENQGNRVVLSNEMPYAEAKRVFELFTEFDVDVHVYTLDHLYIYRPREDDEAYLQTRGVAFTEFDGNFSQFKDDHVMKVIAMNPDMTVRRAANDRIQAEFADINTAYSSGIYIEVNHGGVDKGNAILELGEQLGVSADEIMAIGDNDNDLPMLRKVGLPVSVQNGIPAVKEVATYVTPHDYECGVADAINKFVLNN